MKTNHRALKQKYIIFIASVVLTIVATQLIIQFDLNEQNEDAALINIAGRQRMIGQRIPKTIRYIQDDIVKGEDHHRIDTLKKLIDEWARVHYELIRGNQQESNSAAIDSLLNLNTPYLETIVNAAQRVIDSPHPSVVENAVMEITKAELPSLMIMENTVLTYQREAEQKLSYLKKAELVLSLLSILFLILEFVYIFLPVLNALRVNNKKLIDLNRELGNANQELVSSEEEIRTNLEQISMLQTNLEIRERVYREMVEGVVDMIYELDPDGRFSFVNPVMLSMTGFTRDELIGRPYWELIHEADRDMVIEFYRQQRKRLEDDSYLEFRMISKSSNEVWIGQTVRMFFTNSWIYKVNVVARNITSLKQVQLKLAEREELYRLISENSNDVIVLIDQDRHFSFVSHSAKEVLGFLPEELLGKTIFDLIHDDDKKFIQKQGDEIREQHKTLPLYVFRIRHKNGKYLWVETHSRPFFDANRNVQFVQSSFRDITKRKEAEEKLAESEKLYKLLSENMQDLVTLFTPDGKYTFLSPSVKDVLGYLPEELVGTSAMDLIHPDDLDFLMSVQRVRALSGQKFVNPPFRLKRKDARYIWVEAFTTPVINEKGEIVFIQTTSRNITERKAFEQALLEAKDKAEKATRAKSQFLSMMSHEIRTPMNAIIGLTNLMLEAKPRIDQIESLNLLKFSGENLLTIINDILDFSKIEADKIQIEKIDFDINELLRSTVKMMEHRAKDKQVSIVFQPDEKVQFVKGDPVRIAQVITNLIGNGMKFTEKGEVKLSVQKINQQGSVMTILFEVKDTGIGIPEDRIDSIFESFSQAEGSTTRKFGGTGLGLTITRKLINLMGSQIYVESKLGKGSRFYFNLTLEQGEKPKEEAKEFSDLPALLKHKRVKVLLAEDNKVNQVVAVNFLKKWGVHVTIAGNGKEAIELIKDKSIDIVLMDLQMPEMDGYEATAAIRSMGDSYFKNVPIIALTAEAMIEMREKVLVAGMNDFMSKPFRPEDLQRVIGKHVLHEEEIDLNNSSSHLSGQLDIYTEGNIDFKYELVTYFIRNLQEMKSELERSFDLQDFKIFRTIVHKTKATVGILGYKELVEIVNEVDVTVEKVGADRKKFPKELHHRFYQMCGQIINDLQEEAENIKNLL